MELLPDDVGDLFNCAKKFKISVLKKFLFQHQREVISVGNFLDYFQMEKEENLMGNAVAFFTE
jgi:hypothetical protein